VSGGERSRVTRVGEGQGPRAKRGGVCSGRSGAGKGGAGGCARRAREEVAGRAGRGRERSSCGSGKGRPLSSLARASACRRPGSSCDWARRWSPRQWRLSPPSPALSAARRGLPQPPRPPGACRQHPWPARSRGYAEAKRETAIWMPGWRAPAAGRARDRGRAWRLRDAGRARPHLPCLLPRSLARRLFYRLRGRPLGGGTRARGGLLQGLVEPVDLAYSRPLARRA